MVLFSDRMETKELKPASFHYRRTAGLLIFGPFEWLWRSFTYLKLQPMRVSVE